MYSLTEEELLCGRSYYEGDELAIEEDDDRTEIGSLRNEIIKQARELNLAEEESQSKMKEILTLEDRIERQVQELELVTDHWEDDKQRMKTLQAEITYKARELETVQKHAHQLELGAEISKGTIERLGNQISTVTDLQKKFFHKIDENVTCVVCSEILSYPCGLQCGHCFCERCIAEWMTTCAGEGDGKMHCPICRDEIQKARRPAMMHALDEIIKDTTELKASLGMPIETQSERNIVMQKRLEEWDFPVPVRTGVLAPNTIQPVAPIYAPIRTRAPDRIQGLARAPARIQGLARAPARAPAPAPARSRSRERRQERRQERRREREQERERERRERERREREQERRERERERERARNRPRSAHINEEAGAPNTGSSPDTNSLFNVMLGTESGWSD